MQFAWKIGDWIMWKQLAVSVVAALAFVGCGVPWQEQGNGKKVTRVVDAHGFTKVSNGSQVDVQITVGESDHVEVMLDQNLQDLLDVSVEGDTLKIDNDTSFSFLGEGAVKVTVPQLNAATVTGSGDFKVDGRQSPEDFAVVSSGSGDMSVCSDFRSVDVSNSGSGDVVLCTPVGASRLTRMAINGGGSGDLDWNGDVDAVTINHSGSGNVSLSGNGSSLDVTSTGSGDIDARNLTVGDAGIDSSSSGDVSATLTGTATVRLTGSGNVELWGAQQVNTVVETGSGEIVRH